MSNYIVTGRVQGEESVLIPYKAGQCLTPLENEKVGEIDIVLIPYKAGQCLTRHL